MLKKSQFCVMQILVCAATEMEIAPFIQALSKHKDRNVHLLVTGVGLLPATYALTKDIAARRPDVMIQAGVGGSLDKNNPPAHVVAVQSDCVGDMGVEEEGFRLLFDLNLIPPTTLPWQEGKLVNNSSLPALSGLPLVHGVTVNEITTREDRIRYYRQQLGAQVESMEGAALHYIGLLEKIPFLQIRSLSNFIGERDKAKWQLEEAVLSLNHALQTLCTKLEAL